MHPIKQQSYAAGVLQRLQPDGFVFSNDEIEPFEYRASGAGRVNRRV
jgi:hypothetical protein